MTSPATSRMLIRHDPDTTPPPYGLLTAATPVENAGLALNGVEYETLCHLGVHEWPLHCAPYDRPAGYDSKEPDPSTGWTTADPFAVYAAEECLHAGDEARARELVTARLDRGEQATVERIIYTGMMGNRPAITYDPLVLSTLTALPDLATAVGMVEQFVASEYGQVPTIHVPRWLGTRMMGNLVVKGLGVRAVTAAGSPVVFGTGYDGRPPTLADGTSPGSPDAAWIYATLPVTVRRSDVLTPVAWGEGAFHPATNTPYTMAERSYVVDWPCRAVAVPTDQPAQPVEAINP